MFNFENLMLMKANPTITKAEIAEHFVTLEEMHEYLVKNIKQRFAERELRAKTKAAMKEAREDGCMSGLCVIK